MITRRGVLKGIGATALTGITGTAYAGYVEPMLLTRVKRYAFTPPNWSKAPHLRVAMLADIHACRPWMPPERIAGIVERTNALKPDLTLLLGDYVQGTNLVRERVHSSEWSAELGKLKAPLGVFAVLGNHDWWEDRTAQRAGGGPVIAGTALEKAGIPVLRNDALKLNKDGRSFWLAGLDSQLALIRRNGGRMRSRSMADLSGTMAKISGDEAVIMMAHEPDIFARMPQRVSLTVSGHTHGGQVNILGWTPGYHRGDIYGHIVRNGRHLVISGGLGVSIAPVRVGVPPEIVMMELGPVATA